MVSAMQSRWHSFVSVMYLCSLSMFENYVRTIEQVSSTGINGAADLLPAYLDHYWSLIGKTQYLRTKFDDTDTCDLVYQ
jgi:hypothetical protein